MVVRKVSVFILVVAFHVLALGVVYLSTREPELTTPEVTNAENKENIPKPEINTSGSTGKVSTKPPIEASQKPESVTESLVHVVEKGDYLSKIASKYKVTSKEIMDLNKITDPDKLFLGQKIKIPVK